MSVNVPWLLSLLFAGSVCIGQTPGPNSSASISGRVTISGKGATGIVVTATVNNSPLDNRTVARTTTDDDGNYHLPGLAAGRFTITPIAKAFVVAAGDTFKQPGQTVNVAENESITKIDFALVRGGVITGRITDLEGSPIIGEAVNIAAKGDSGDARPTAMFPTRKNQTDDRGVYRIYGLGPGTYKVSVGQATPGGGGANILGMGGSQYAKTFYPGVTEESKATVIEIAEGAEVANIDITLGKPDRGFSASGRVVDAESGNAVASAYIGYRSLSAANQQTGGMSFTGIQTDANGKFRLDGMQPGHYSAFVMAMGQDNSSYSDPAPFDVSDGDVTGIEIKVRRGATIEGVAVIENNMDPAAAALLQSVSLFAYVADAKSTNAPSFSFGKINPDGSFQLAGLAPGKAQVGMQGFPTPPKGLQLVRTELEGLPQPEGLDVAAGAHITGVRLVFAYGTGKIRGEVKTEGGVLPEGTGFRLSINATASGAQSNRFLDVDARGHFASSDIPPGTYVLTLSSGSKVPAFEPVTRTITVANGAETQVIFVVNLAAKKQDQS
jgi:protocatechuate 3,4-dioxygenase beta subunit